MDVTVSTFRSEMSAWLERVKAGEEVVVTDRGVPVARLLPVGVAPLLERLTADGVLARPGSASRPTASTSRRVTARGPVADLVAEQRR